MVSVECGQLHENVSGGGAVSLLVEQQLKPSGRLSSRCGVSCLLLVAAAATFYTNLEPVPLCAVLAPLSVLILAETLSSVCWFMGVSILIGLALGVSCYGYLLSASLIIGVAIQLVLSIAYIAHRVIARRHPNSAIASLAFPCIHTALFVLAMRTLPIGSTGNPAYSLTELTGLTQCAALLGRNGVAFLVSWAAAAGSRAVVAGLRCPAAKRGLCACLLVWALTAFFGGVRLTAPHLFSGIDSWDEANIGSDYQVSCLSTYEGDIYEETRGRLAAGDTIIIHSERATDMYLDANATVARYATLAQQSYSKTGVEAVIVLSFVYEDYSWYHLVNRGGSQMSYAKNHPVPIVESDIQGGNIPPHVVRLPLGGSRATGDPGPRFISVTGSVCFDTDYPGLTRPLAGADLWLQSSATWYNIGEEHLQGHKYVAIENAVTLIKCTHMGSTGVYDPRGNLLFDVPQTEGKITFTVPQFTVGMVGLAWVGTAFDIAVCGAALAWLLLCARPALSGRLLGSSDSPSAPAHIDMS